MTRALVKLARNIDWAYLEERLKSQPPLTIRLTAAPAILNHMHNLSDEALCDRWIAPPISGVQGAAGRERQIAKFVQDHEVEFDQTFRQLVGFPLGFFLFDRVDVVNQHGRAGILIDVR